MLLLMRVLKKQREWAEKETDEKAKEKAHRRYLDAVLSLTKAFAISAASNEARQIRDEVAFFQTVRIAILKCQQGTGGGEGRKGGLAVQQLIDDAISSTEIVDILQASGIKAPDISIR